MTAITLPPDLEAWAEAEVAAGRAESVDAAIEQRLRQSITQTEWIRGKLDEARASLARGQGIDGADMVAELDRWIAEDLAADEASRSAAE